MTYDRLRAAFLEAALPATMAGGLGLSSIFSAAAFNDDMLGQAGLIKNTTPHHEMIEERHKEQIHTMAFVNNMTGMG